MVCYLLINFFLSSHAVGAESITLPVAPSQPQTPQQMLEASKQELLRIEKLYEPKLFQYREAAFNLEKMSVAVGQEPGAEKPKADLVRVRDGITHLAKQYTDLRAVAVAEIEKNQVQVDSARASAEKKSAFTKEIGSEVGRLKDLNSGLYAQMLVTEADRLTSKGENDKLRWQIGGMDLKLVADSLETKLDRSMMGDYVSRKIATALAATCTADWDKKCNAQKVTDKDKFLKEVQEMLGVNMKVGTTPASDADPRQTTTPREKVVAPPGLAAEPVKVSAPPATVPAASAAGGAPRGSSPDSFDFGD